MDDVVAFGRLVEALRPWLGHLVIVGGWAHHLYRYHPNASAPPHILLINPWVVRLEKSTPIPISRPTDLRVASPVCFLAQKLLIHGRRETDKKAQDVLYVHDTLQLFGRRLDALRTEWLERVSPELHGRTTRQIDRLRHEQFDTVTDVIRNAVRIPQDRTLVPAHVQAACAYGLEEIFGPASAPRAPTRG